MICVEEPPGAEVAGRRWEFPTERCGEGFLRRRQRFWQKLQEEPHESRELSVASRAISRLLKALNQACSVTSSSVRRASEWSALVELRALGKQLPSCSRCSRAGFAKAQLLAKLNRATDEHDQDGAAALSCPERRRKAAACLILLFRLWAAIVTHRRMQKGFRATVVTQAQGTHFVHERKQGDEWCGCRTASCHRSRTAAQKGERFRVIVPDGEVEVRGTAFETEVVEDHLVSGAGCTGRVEVRPHSNRSLILGDGERWQARLPTVTSSVPPQPPAENRSRPRSCHRVARRRCLSHRPAQSIDRCHPQARRAQAQVRRQTKASVIVSTPATAPVPAVGTEKKSAERPAVLRAAPISAGARVF